MARTKTAPAKPAEPEETDEGGVVRGPGEMHELFSQWLKDEYDVEVSADAIFWVTSKRTAFRKSDTYIDYAEGLDAAREEARRAKEERRAARAAAQEEDEAEETPKPAKRGRARKSAVAGDVVEDGDEAQTEVAPARPARGRRKTAPAAETAEAPAPAASSGRGRRRTGGPSKPSF